VKSNVLFICVHNSARSQMAEAWLNQICGDFFAAESAGLEPGTLNPLVVEAMEEVGIDISKKETRAVFDVFKAGKLFSYVITVCDETSAEKCPIFPGIAKGLHWSFSDPATLIGSREDKLVEVRKIRDEIRDKIQAWCQDVCPRPPGVVTSA
jgi:arsenate reductase